MTFVASLPHLTAAANMAATACLFAGFIAARAGRRDVHRRFMMSAVAASMLFLVFYLLRMQLAGTSRFPELGVVRTVYLAILGSHTLLAAAVPLLVGRMLFLAWRRRFPEHRKLARWAWPIWMYVSFTGVVVYAMVHHVAPRLVGG